MNSQFNPETLISEAIGPYDDYCNGYGTPGNSGNAYMLGMILGVAAAPLQFSHKGSQLLDEINAFDKAEVEDSALGQINMITVSSFCGPRGLILGYDFLKHPKLRKTHPLGISKVMNKKHIIPVYSIEPILSATRELFGSLQKKRYPLLPGSHVPCAGKHKNAAGPNHVYAAIAIGIPKDRNKNACLLMEDIGYLPIKEGYLLLRPKKREEENILDIHRKKILENITKSVVQIGINQKVQYKEIYAGIKDLFVNKNEVGCALVAAPYFTLAKKAIPLGKSAEILTEMSLNSWKRTMKI